MHVTLLAIGSRGDVQPYVALGIGLSGAGHTVRVATHPYFESVVRSHGLEFAPIAGDPRESLESDMGQAWLATGTDGIAFARRMLSIMQPMMQQAVHDTLTACRETDLVLYSLLGGIGALHVLEKLGTAGWQAYLQPATPTRAFPPVVAPSAISLGGLHNRLMHAMGERFYWQLFRRSLDGVRQEVLDLPPMPRRAPFAAMRKRNITTLYGYSPTLLPRPGDWPSNTHVTGYWSLPADDAWKPPSALAEFLDRGPAPVYVGFGSMHARDAVAQTRIVCDALSRAEQRGILLTGWGALSDSELPDHVFGIDSVPHDWLFPRVTAVVHHCGAGTTGAGLRAGVPTVPVPFFGDQPFWSRRLHMLGVAAQPLPIKRLSTARLAQRIRHVVSSPEMRARAAAVGERVRSEDGVGRVVMLVEQLASGG